MLEPRNLLTSVVAGLRFMLNRLGNVSNESIDYPIGIGESYLPVNVKLADIAYVSGDLAGSGEVRVAGLGDKVYRLSNLPRGIVLFAKSASSIDDVMMRGMDFTEIASGTYIFKKSPVNCGVVSVDDGGSCTWVCTIGSATHTDLQDRLNKFKGSTNQRLNRQIASADAANDALNGQSTVVSYLCTGADALLDNTLQVTKLWMEGDDCYCLDNCNKLHKLSKSQFESASVGSKLSDLALSGMAVMYDGSRLYATDMLNSGGNFDVSGLNDISTVKLLDTLTSKLNNTQNAQKLLVSSRLSGADELLIYYHSSDSIPTARWRADSVADCIARAETLYGVIHINDKPYTKYWVSDNGKIYGKRPSPGDYIIGVTGVFHSQDTGIGDILVHEDVNNEFIRPSSIILVEAVDNRE